MAVAAQILEMENPRKPETCGASPESAAGTSEEPGFAPNSVVRRTRSAEQGVNPEGEATFLEDKTGPSRVESQL